MNYTTIAMFATSAIAFLTHYRKEILRMVPNAKDYWALIIGVLTLLAGLGDVGYQIVNRPTVTPLPQEVVIVDPPAPPIGEPVFRVLITYSAAHKATLPREQLALLDSPTFRAWLDKNCAKDPSGQASYRIWDAAIPVGDDQPIWQQAMHQQRGADNWLIATNGHKKISVPLPANEAAAIELLGKLRGA